MSGKKELVLNAFHNKPVERIPVGFWFHFLGPDQMNLGLDFPELMEKNLEGHRKFKEEFDPDFVKIMTDGLFFRPFSSYPAVSKAADLRNIQPLPKDHPYFAANLRHARAVREIFGNDTLIFFNVFSPLYHLVNRFGGSSENLDPLYEYYREDKEAVAYALDVVSKDLTYLVDLILTEGGADGIYLSVYNGHKTFSAEEYTRYITPSEVAVLDAARKHSEDNILHICGNRGSLIHTGTKEEIEAFTEKLIAENGKVGIVIGADCTVPGDTPVEHLKWVRDKAAELS